MLIHTFDDSKFDELIEKGTVLIDFYADWCGPCKMLLPIIEDFSKEHDDITIIKVNVDKYPDIAQKYGVMTIPTLILYKDNKLVKKQVGFIPLDALEEWVSE